MNETGLTEKEGARIIRAITLEFPKVAQRLGVSKCSAHILIYLKANGEKSLEHIRSELNIDSLHFKRVAAALERNKYITRVENGNYQIAVQA